jgi:hypothetical protein
MKKIVWTFGIIAGLINAAWLISFLFAESKINFDNGELIGYTAMVVAFSLIFFAVRSYRDKHLDGTISFGKAFKVGLYISLIASAVYVVTWLIEYNFFMPDFMDQYSTHMLDKMKKAGQPEIKIREAAKQMEDFNKLYKNPFINAGFTFMEIFPVGLVVSLISAAVLKRKTVATA